MEFQKPTPNIAALTAAAVTAAAGLFHHQADAEPVVLNSIKAVVNGEPITQTMVDQAVQTQVQVWLMGNKGMVSRSQAEREIRKMEERALNDLVDRKLILSEFKKLGGNIKDQYIDDSVNRFVKERFDGDRDKFHSELKKTGMTIAQFRDMQEDQIAIQALRTQNVGEDPVPNTPWEKRRKYNEIKEEFASEGRVKLRIMSIAKQSSDGGSLEEQKAHMQKVHSQLRSGGDFATLAKRYSQDSFASKGGYVGDPRGVLNQGLTRMAYSLPSGQISAPLDDGPFWRILKVDGRVGQTTPSFEKLEEEVDKRLTIEKRQKKQETWLKKLRRDANVRIYED